MGTSPEPTQAKNYASTPESKTTAGPIPLPQISNRAEQLDTLIFQIQRHLNPSGDLLSADEMLARRNGEILNHTRILGTTITAGATPLELRDEEFYWSSMNRECDKQRKLLASQAIELENGVRLLDRERADWQATLDQILPNVGIAEVVNRVSEELARITSTQREVTSQLNIVLTLQDKALQQNRRIVEAQEQLVAAQKELRQHWLERSGPPLWAVHNLQELERPLSGTFWGAAVQGFKGLRQYAQTNSSFLTAILGVYLVTLSLAFVMRSYVSNIKYRSEMSPDVLIIFSRPFSVAMLVALLGTVGQLHRVTTGVAAFITWLWLIQALRLVSPLAKPEVKAVLRGMVPFLILETLRSLLPFSTAFKRQLFVFNMLGAFVVLLWLDRRTFSHNIGKGGRISRFLLIGTRIGMYLLLASIISNIFGFLLLSHTISMAVMLGFLGAIVFYGSARVLSLALSMVLRTNWIRSVTGAYSNEIEIWVTRVLIAGATFSWLAGMLRLFGIYDAAITLLSNIFRHHLGYGTIHFSLGNIVSVLLTLCVGYGFARIAMSAINRFLLPRLHLERGAPYSISRIVYYLFLLIVAIAATAQAGIELNRFTVLTGALGVGLGFGLQNIVNNFISGLILLFERPIHVGDTVDVGGLVGTVRRIGARSSTVLTFQGAEVIVPNSNLITTQVINWTLSSPLRRVEIPVGVAHGTDPQVVLNLLVEVANSHPRVLRERPPAAFFLGFGDSTLNVELRFWSASHETWFELRSEVTLAISKALKEVGIEIPFPQHDVHLRSVRAHTGSDLPAEPNYTRTSPYPSTDGQTLPALHDESSESSRHNL